MKILFVNSYYAPDEVGGAERSVRFLAETMASRGHDVSVICLGATAEIVALNDVRIQKIATQNLYFALDSTPKSKLQKIGWHLIDSYNPLASNTLFRLVAELKPDLIHTNTLAGISVSVWAVAKRLGVPIVHTLRDYYLMCPNTAMFKDDRSCLERCTPCKVLSIKKLQEAKNVDVVVGNSKFILDHHIKAGYFNNAEKFVVYNAYQPKSALASKDNDVLTLGYIGRLAPTKGVGVLLESFRRIASETNCKLFVAGEGDESYVTYLKSLAKGLNVDFLGRVSPEDFYSKVSWTVMPSLWDEPLARVIFESFAHGVPVIGSATGGTPELVTDGENGFLYQPTPDGRFLDALLKQVIARPELALTMKSRCLTDAEQFKPEVVIGNYMRVYEAALAKSKVLRS